MTGCTSMTSVVFTENTSNGKASVSDLIFCVILVCETGEFYKSKDICPWNVRIQTSEVEDSQ